MAASEDSLQISEFIKNPGSLKLLILAGTNIRVSELSTVAKCHGLIKLDLSLNSLAELPLNFQAFPQLKILYLHDNKLTSAPILRSNVEYLSLFKNPVSHYRKSLIAANPKLLALDFLAVSQAERAGGITPLPYGEIKWPIVEVSNTLEQEEDYLNLLKAEIFVVRKVHERAQAVCKIHSSVKTFLNWICCQTLIQAYKVAPRRETVLAEKVVNQWRHYVQKRRKLRHLLGNKSHLLLTQTQRVLMNCSANVLDLVKGFGKIVISRVGARKILTKWIRAYKNYLPALNKINQLLMPNCSRKSVESPFRMYVRKSELNFFDKITMYAKKILFNRKNYDLCDSFDAKVHQGNRKFYIIRESVPKNTLKSFLMHSIGTSIRLIVSEIKQQKKRSLYGPDGHRWIGIKGKKQTHKVNWDKFLQTNKKLDGRKAQYDILTQIVIQDAEIFTLIMKLIRFFNMGSSDKIMNVQSAYFQTEVVFDSPAVHKSRHIRVVLASVFDRLHSALIIQRTWRRIRAVKKSPVNVISSIRESRAKVLMQRWVRSAVFQHRMAFVKQKSFTKSFSRERELYIHLELYLNLPEPKDLLRLYFHKPVEKSNQVFYDCLHKNAQVSIVNVLGRKMIRFYYTDYTSAHNADLTLRGLTFRFKFNGFCVKLIRKEDINHVSLVEYQKAVKELYGVILGCDLQALNKPVVKLPIFNAHPVFIWNELEQAKLISYESLQNASRFPISMFIYNKNMRPLKVHSDMIWAMPPSIYPFRKEPVKAIKYDLGVRGQAGSRFQDLHKTAHTLLDKIPLHQLPGRDRRASFRSQTKARSSSKTKSKELDDSLLSQTLTIRKK